MWGQIFSLGKIAWKAIQVFRCWQKIVSDGADIVSSGRVLQKVPLPSPLSSHIWKLNCLQLRMTRTNISSAAGAFDSNSWHMALPINVFDIWHWHFDIMYVSCITCLETRVFCGKFFPNSVGKFAKFRSSLQQILHIVINLLWHLNPTKYAVFVAGNCNWQIQSVYQTSWQYFR